jgi:hypothetical protein
MSHVDSDDTDTVVPFRKTQPNEARDNDAINLSPSEQRYSDLEPVIRDIERMVRIAQLAAHEDLESYRLEEMLVITALDRLREMSQKLVRIYDGEVAD